MRRSRAASSMGPLTGVPITIKVLTDQTGFATTNGLRLQRDLIAQTNSPLVDNFLKSGATIVGRTNTPAFSYRWFTDNQLHGLTKNPHNNAITPGGSSGGAGAATAAGIGHIGHGTDIAGSVRYPAYACGIHGLRLTLGRAPNFNASGPERSIGAQIMAVSGPLARTIADLRLALEAMAAPHAPDARDPWYVPVPIDGPKVAKRAALCIAPDRPRGCERGEGGAGRRSEAAGARRLDGRGDRQHAATEGGGRSCRCICGSATIMKGSLRRPRRKAMRVRSPACAATRKWDGRWISRPSPRRLIRRATLTRQWQMFFDKYPVLLMPVSGELPFADQLDLRDADSWARVWRAQVPMIGTPFMGLPGLTVSTGMVGQTPVGVQLVAGRYREDLCLAAGEAIEAGGVPPSPVDPVGFA